MPRSPENNQQIRDARRDSILRAAERVFAQKGFSFTKISDIAAEAGLSHGLVYHYFRSKEALFAALMDEMMMQLESQFDEEGESPRQRLTRTLTASFERMQNSPESMQLMTQAMLIGGLPDGLREAAFERATHLRERMQVLVEACQERGEIVADIDPAQLTSVIVCLIRGMSIRPPGDGEMPFPMPEVTTLIQLLRPRESEDHAKND